MHMIKVLQNEIPWDEKLGNYDNSSFKMTAFGQRFKTAKKLGILEALVITYYQLNEIKHDIILPEYELRDTHHRTRIAAKTTNATE